MARLKPISNGASQALVSFRAVDARAVLRALWATFRDPMLA